MLLNNVGPTVHEKAQFYGRGMVLYNLSETSVSSLRLVSTNSKPFYYDSSFSKGFESLLYYTGNLKNLNILSYNKIRTNVKTFLELGELRNNLVHQNAGTYVIDKTTEEVYEQYKKALSFLVFLKGRLT